jgi:hypothetical protein
VSPGGAIESSQAIHRLDSSGNQDVFVPLGTTYLWGGLSSQPRLKEKPQAGKPAPQCSDVPMGLAFFYHPFPGDESPGYFHGSLRDPNDPDAADASPLQHSKVNNPFAKRASPVTVQKALRSCGRLYLSGSSSPIRSRIVCSKPLSVGW